MTDDLALQMQLSTLRHELAQAKRKSNASLGFSGVAFVVVGFLWISHLTLNPPAPAAPQPPRAQSAVANIPPNIILQGIEVKSIEITDSNGDPAATLDATGLSFVGANQQVSFSSSNITSTSLNSRGLSMNGDNGVTTMLTPGAILMRPSSSFNTGTTTIFAGLMSFDTPQNYTLALGAFNSGPLSVGVDIYNDHFDKAHANGGTVDQTGASLTPSNMSFVDASDTERASFGQTQLVTQTTGATAITALSSITLFDKSGHVSWETPQ